MIYRAQASRSLYAGELDAVRVDILIPNFEQLGAQRVAINAANGLFERGYDVRFVVLEEGGPFRTYLLPDIPVFNSSVGYANIPKFRVVLRILAYIRGLPKGPSILISFSPGMNLFVLVARWFRPESRTIIQEHAFQSVALKDRTSHSWMYEFFYRNLWVKFYRKADIFLTISEMIRQDFVDVFGLDVRRTAVIRNPIDIENVKKLASCPVEEFEFDPKREYLIGVGRLTGQKNFPRLIRIFHRVAQRRADVDLLILGSGEDQETLENLVFELGLGNRVFLLGFRSNPYAYIARSSVFCLSSDWEGLPQVIAEAMVCGTAVVSHTCPSGPDEMIVDGVTGRLVPYGDEEVFAGVIEQLLDNPDERTRLAHEGQRVACHDYSLSHFIDAYIEMFRKLA